MIDTADGLIRSFDDKLNDMTGLNCRTWALKVIALLKEGGIVKCEDLVALEREVLDWSNVPRFSAVMAKKPRPFADSKLCQL